MGETTDGGLYEIFQQDYGPVGSSSFEAARENFIISSAGYAVASLLLQAKDRHNGNLLFDNVGRLVHIDFGFILETSPGGNMRFESAHFKLSHEMTQLLDPSGTMKSETWNLFVRSSSSSPICSGFTFIADLHCHRCPMPPTHLAQSSISPPIQAPLST
ncbi:phosphatidylinositol 4-kinase alpha 2-like [Quercus robur]|uniref:phosphatidylinositol 4-kinase alpha 2-like n=1 Tax=Quercus robur TaxID=38942 RepID=UPI002161D496|nr:phosphatidylinositol 4-kinase alpha 2-like [Quercus robur]